jgi:hypothetical protein
MVSSSTARSRSPSLTPSKLPPVPSSPTYSYASTALPGTSTFNLPLPPIPTPLHAVLSKADLELSQTAYHELLSSAKAYRLALAALSTAASTFGSSLEACARLKEARSESINPGNGMGSLSNSWSNKGSCTADSLLAASGVHQLIANHQQILSEVVYRSFEVPLLHELDTWTRKIEEEEVTYQTSAKAMSKEIRRMEKEGMKVYKSRKRDVKRFREHLVNLTSKLDGLTSLHGGYARGLLRDCQETSSRIVDCSAGLVRAEVDIFEALARKGWSGGGLDELLEKGRDLFANDEALSSNPNDNSQIFSILPQKSILVDVPEGQETSSVSGIVAVARERPDHKRSDSLLVEGVQYQSLVGAVSNAARKDTDSISILSERTGLLNRSRGVRPFSPPPADRVPDPGPLSNDREEDLEESKSAKTVTLRGSGEGEGSNGDKGKEKGDVDGERGRDGASTERERRWSVTDDGAVSD